ncbi:MAG: hypothetical protein ACREQ9_11040 [Candidatus Binatia bacterium]
MRDSLRTPLRAIVALLTLAALSVPVTARAHLGTFHDIWSIVLRPYCDSCHGPNGFASSGLIVGLDSNGTTEGTWYSALVGVRPTNAAAASLGKLRVTPFQPENSFLLDKITGHLKLREGRGMPFDTTPQGYAHTCPGAVDKITRWILQGALERYFAPGSGNPTYDPNDVSPGQINCFGALAQPAFSAGPPAGAVQLRGDTFMVESPSSGQNEKYEGEWTSARALSADLLVGRIEVIASAGTEYVAISRGDLDANGGEIPLVVARGRSLDLELPPGVAVSLAASQPITIRQRIRNDYWVGNINRTTGDVAVNLYPAASMDHEAVPFLEATGTQMLFVPPRGLGQTGGAWTPSGAANGARVGIWGDRRILEASLADPATGTLETAQETSSSSGPGPALTRGYVSLDGGAGALTYQCTHSNGFTTLNESSAQYLQTLSLLATTSTVNRPMKFACLDRAPAAGGLPPAPPGMPGLLAGTPVKDCRKSIHDPAWTVGPVEPKYDNTDCAAAPVDQCVPANLVGGDGANEGRCSLIGLMW